METKILKVFKTLKAYLLASDKWLHLAAGFIITFFTGIFSPLYGFIAGILAAAGKEVYDKVSKKGTPELWDFIFTVIGVLLAILNIWISRLFYYLLG